MNSDALASRFRITLVRIDKNVNYSARDVITVWRNSFRM